MVIPVRISMAVRDQERSENIIITHVSLSDHRISFIVWDWRTVHFVYDVYDLKISHIVFSINNIVKMNDTKKLIRYSAI